MFKRLYNEASIYFEMKTVSPLFINAGDKDQLDPTAADNTFLTMYRDGKLVPVIPGSSLKGVFRSSAEQLLPGSCDIFRDPCAKKIEGKEKMKKKEEKTKTEEIKENEIGKERYKASCPACKLFGSTVLKSRIAFNDAYPVGAFRVGHRTSVAIDRITGAAKTNALYEFEYVEDASFKCEIRLKNFFRWHLKLLFEVFDRIDQGFVTFGGFTSKGFGQMKIQNVALKVKYYDKKKQAEGYIDKGFYIEKQLTGRETILALLIDVSINDNAVLQGCELEDDKAL
ncbi:type III CRISPR-associated RAMP protein Csx7 [Caldicoprobacter faecalis]|jgi:CRISPR-associated RAMP protein (TIGR02581 family)|uniref:CRISPR-associated protein, Csx7 family n=1 Tax=Caldicoprobacter faecalis TaxID=937334 RepID=A0A1I5T1P5_9FIRM|nr:CRISPR-associated RAMP protein Csx7 [Caldicoprobacter faecalis]PZN08450.1 MAG: CRISPR-associated RAMP protein [Caldicoprobacter oshimai]SFP76974.1 CRISPR-associated protein, Csx7 family [Caldicoprobacter faecalis]